MPSDLDLSRAVCRVCGEGKVLSADPGEVAQELASFSATHSHHAAFRIDVIVAGHEELPESEGISPGRAVND